MRPLVDTMSGIVIIATDVIATQSWNLDRAMAMRHRLEVLARELKAAAPAPFATMLAVAADHALDFVTAATPLTADCRNRLERWRSIVGALLPMVQADRDYEHELEAARRAMRTAQWPVQGAVDAEGLGDAEAKIV